MSNDNPIRRPERGLRSAERALLAEAEELSIDTRPFFQKGSRFTAAEDRAELQRLIEARKSEIERAESELLSEADPQQWAPGSELALNYVDGAMYDAEPIRDALEAPSVTLLYATSDPLGAIASMCSMYEGTVVRSLAEISDTERRRAWENVNKTHLKAPLESVDFMFLLEGVTRAFTHQLVRQRTAVYAQESMRFAVKQGSVEGGYPARSGPLVSGDAQARAIWERGVEAAWNAYNDLIAHGMPAEEARGLLPHDTLTRVIYKTNLRNLLEHAGNRLCTQAQFEWRLLFGGIVASIRDYSPHRTVDASVCDGSSVHKWQFEYIANSGAFKPVCFSLGHCPFTAEFDRGCTIRERVDRGEFGSIEPAEWLCDPTAGWIR